MIENRVVSLPPCWVALEVKAPPTLPCNAPPIQRRPACSQKLPIAEGMRPKRVARRRQWRRNSVARRL
jgi:hypothetical protein